jgi:alpha-L-arabinofuranosidase
MMRTIVKALSLLLVLHSSSACSSEKEAAPPPAVASPLEPPPSMGTPPEPPPALSTPPAAYLTFDEGSGTTAGDASGNGYAATLLGGAAWSTGVVGASSLALPGTPGSFAEVPGLIVDTTQSFTVAAWVKLNSLTGYQTFVSEDGDVLSAFFLQFRGDSLRFSFTVPYDFFVLPQSGFLPELGKWYHLAGVYDATAQTASLYVDGVHQDTVYGVVSSAATGLTAIGRGKFNGNPVDFVNGGIDDVRLYSSALPASEVLDIAKQGDATLPGPLPVEPAVLQIDAATLGHDVSPLLTGLMIEEINHSLDGGLYAELIQNRAFLDDAVTPLNWALVVSAGASGTMALDTTQPIADTALTTSLRVTADGAGDRVGVANGGFWGIPVRPMSAYRASFFAKGEEGRTGPLTVSLESADGGLEYASSSVAAITTAWARYNLTLETASVPTTSDARLVISTTEGGTFWINLVSLFPDTYGERPNGNRIDLMNLLADLRPTFLRFPGGNFLEGTTIADRFQWKQTIGPLETRPGNLTPWTYRSSNGLGLLEYLLWCEELNMVPVLGVYAGYSLDGSFINPGPDLEPYVQDALDEIEYVTGGTDTVWGARRAADGHPEPFPLEYVEIGNEDFFDVSGSYDARYAQFEAAIRAAYPNLKLIATTAVSTGTPEVLDEHFYDTPRAVQRLATRYDTFSRTGQKIFVGEFAAIEGRPTPNLNAALADAAFMTGVERNSDVVIMAAYAPLLANVNPGASQWPTNLIGYDALQSYGSPSYHVQSMFGRLRGDVTLPATLTTSGGSQLFQSVTLARSTGTIYIKLVNAVSAPQDVRIELTGLGALSPEGQAEVLASSSVQDTNTLSDPNRVVPMRSTVTGIAPQFDYQLEANSFTVLSIQSPSIVAR